jgi:carbonic anhydrase
MFKRPQLRSTIRRVRLPGVYLIVASATLLLACRSAGKEPAPASPAAPVSSASVSARPAEWGYEGDRGPAHWADLTPVYADCTRSHQSPIDISEARETSGTWRTDYRKTGLRIAHHEHVTDILDNGHTIQVTVDEGSTLTTERGSYALKQFHFHTPSEHTVNGKSFPMEAHFVHQNAAGGFAVLSVLFEEGPANPNLATLIAHFPEAKGDAKVDPEVRLELSAHLPSDSSAHNYVGSFTTPPCTESVEWIVLRSAASASSEQLQAFAQRLNHNNRPIQALNGRDLVLGKVAGSLQD